MTIQNMLLVAGGLAIVSFSFWMLWPRKRPEASAESNWQQRDGTERFGASAINPTLHEADVAIGAAMDSAIGGSR